MNEDNIRKLLEQIAAMLHEDTVRIDVSRGVHRSAGDDGNWHYEPTHGVTITIQTHGGAQLTEDSLVERLQRWGQRLAQPPEEP